ncbi:hypothetical protein [Streptomyces sp. NRRL F-5630]|uniref:hypothetical protein n=1 Tax=Streptomyces sp. NRRL F-5630 TaxID=1463864 RepID=UPI003D72BD40
MAAEEAKPKVDNPDRARLVALLARMKEERGSFVSAFELAAKEIGKGSATADMAWVGETAERWHGQVARQRTKVRDRMDAVMEDVQRYIDAMPAQVTQEEAVAMSRVRPMD